MFFAFLTIFLFRCSAPSQPECIKVPATQLSDYAAYVLCEGLWHYDNATLYRVDFPAMKLYEKFFQMQNCELKLGDTGNDLFLWNDTLYAVITESRAIEQIDASTGMWLNRLQFTDAQPRYVCLINSERGYVTILNQDKVLEFHPKTMMLTGREVSVGPAPEAITTDGVYLYVVNSGYGDFRTGEPKANTLSVIDPETMQEVYVVQLPPNPIDVVLGNDKIYVAYYHLPSQKDSSGGVVVLDKYSYKLLQHFKIQNPLQLLWDTVGNACYVLSPTSVYRIDSTIAVVLHQDSLHNQMWYSFALSPFDRTLWIADAKDFISYGQITVWDLLTRRQRYSVEVGLNPGDIVFFMKRQ